MAKVAKAKNFSGWLEQRLGTSKIIKILLTEYWVPKKINFLWAMGIVLMVLFLILLFTGIMLLIYYTPTAELAFDSVNKTIAQDVAFGWLWRNMHAIAASLIFLVIYIHMLTGIYYGSYKSGREVIWVSGVLLLVLFSAAAFTGYILPWGQMSYWAAQVITDLFAKIPYIGDSLSLWVRGDYSVANATLTRFFAAHVVLIPLIIIAVIAFHFYSLRVPHVNNEKGEDIDFEKEAKKYKNGNKKESKVIPFWPVFISKDFFVVGLFLIFFFYIVGFQYSFALDPVNFERADHLKTPLHIYPEWYFLWFYETLRGFFFDILGIKAMYLGIVMFMLSNVILFFMPWLDRNKTVQPAHNRKYFKYWFWLFIVDLIVLSVYGKLEPLGSNARVGFVATIFLILLFVSLPFITKLEAKSSVVYEDKDKKVKA